MTALRLSHLSKKFGKTRALDDVSLTVERGELFFLLGPSGCGKTTLLRTIAGFCEPDSGALYFDERDVTGLPPYARNTGMVFQNYALWPHMSVGRNVAFGLQQKRLPKEEVERRTRAALARVRMEDAYDVMPNTLSGGQQQRVGLARAVVVEPECLLLDEPLSNLDARLRTALRAEIRDICKAAGLTAVYVTHDQKEALAVADRIAVMKDGKVRQVGAPMEIYRRPVDKFVAAFVGESDFFKGTLVRAGAGEGLVKTEFGEWRAALGGVAPERLRAGDAVVVCVRPEAWRLDIYPAEENCVEGRVRDSVFLGEMTQCVFAPADAALSPVRVWRLNRDGGDPAEATYAWFDPEDAVILPD